MHKKKHLPPKMLYYFAIKFNFLLKVLTAMKVYVWHASASVYRTIGHYKLLLYYQLFFNKVL